MSVADLIVKELYVWLKKRWQNRKRRREKKILIQRLKGKKSITFESTDGRWCLFDISTDVKQQRFIERFMVALKKGDK